MTKRDELIKEMRAMDELGRFLIPYDYLADFILRREEALLAEIEKPLKRWMNSSSSDYVEASTRVEDALNIIEKARKG